MSRRDDLSQLLATSPLFAGLGSRVEDDVVARSDELHLEPGEILYRSGEAARGIFVLLRGALQIEYPRGGEHRGPVAVILCAPGILGEGQALNHRPWSGSGVAHTHLLALYLPLRAFHALIGAHAELARRLYLELSLRFLKAIETWRFQPDHDPELRVARYVLGSLEAHERADPGHDGVSLPWRQTELAAATDLRPETVNRVLGAWREAGQVELVERRVRVLNRGALQGIAARSQAPPLIQSCQLPPIPTSEIG